MSLINKIYLDWVLSDVKVNDMLMTKIACSHKFNVIIKKKCLEDEQLIFVYAREYSFYLSILFYFLMDDFDNVFL